MTSKRCVKFVIAGQIRNEFIIDINGKTSHNRLGGSLIYAAAAVTQWGGQAGLLGVVERNFPLDALEELEKKELDIRGIKVAPLDIELRSFYAYPTARTCIRENPVAVYATNHLPFPKELLGYTFDDDEPMRENFTLYSKLLLENIPSDYLDATGAHICPFDLTCQIQLTTLLQKGSARIITLQPHQTAMIPARFDEIAILTKDVTAIITQEIDLRNLYQSRSTDLWEMMEMICSHGCKTVIVRNIRNGYSLFDSVLSRKYSIPEYPARVTDPTGEADVFCGAFMVGYQTSYDPLYAALLASAAASIKVEVTGPFSMDSSLTGLDKARMSALRDMVTRY